jgi:hypothetical protein
VGFGDLKVEDLGFA